MLRHGLARHRQLRGELGRRRVAPLGERLDDVAAVRVREGGEDRPQPVCAHASAGVPSIARSSSAAETSQLASRTVTLVPPGVSSSSNSTSLSASSPSVQRKPKRRGGSTSPTTAVRVSPLPQRKPRSPPVRTSSSTSVANHSSSRSASVSASQTSSGGAGSSTSRVTSMVYLLRATKRLRYRATEWLHPTEGAP